MSAKTNSGFTIATGTCLSTSRTGLDLPYSIRLPVSGEMVGFTLPYPANALKRCLFWIFSAGEPSGCVGGFCTTGGCLTDGPFKDQVVHLGPFSSTAPNNYCLKREFNAPLPAGYFNPGAVAMTMSQNEFETFWHYLEGVSGLYAGQHGAGHAGVGGQVGVLLHA